MERNIGNILYKTAASAVLICIIVFLSACSGINKTEYTKQSETAAPTFNDVFVSFTELKNTSFELLNERPSEQWWSKFDSVYGGVGSIQTENNKLLNSETLGEVDKRLAVVLSSVTQNYYDAFEVMIAACGNEDLEIVNYAYNEFSLKIANANSAWDEEIAAVTANSEIQ